MDILLSVKYFRFLEDTKLCVCTTIDAYLERSKGWRKDNKQLLLAHIEPHAPVATSSVSRWIKQGLELANIDTSIFSGHATRSASSTKAKLSGLSVSDILKRGHWTNESTFQKIYNKSTRSESDERFQKAVLQNKL